MSAAAVSWAWREVRARSYPAAVGVVLVYLAGKAKRVDGVWVTAASHGELAAISGSRIRTVREVMAKLYTDRLLSNAPRGLSPSRSQRAMFIAVAEAAARAGGNGDE